MKSFTVVALACCVALAASASYMSKDVKYADKPFLDKQKFILDVLQHVYQDDVLLEKYKEFKDYKITDGSFLNAAKTKEFYEWHLTYPVASGEIFSLFKPTHLSYAKALINIFFDAKDYETFYKTALWARFNVNREVFVYALSVAVAHRPDLQGVVLPALYEILPYYFFNSETIQKAQQYKMQGFNGVKKVEGVYSVVIPSNYSGIHGHVNEENLLSYFTEDIGLNDFYYNYNLDYPFWASQFAQKSFSSDRRGAFYFWVHQQLLARYYLERLSNNLPDVEDFNFFSDKFPGYFSGLRYYSGANFPDRENNYGFYHSDNFFNIDLVYLYAHRIYDAIDFKQVTLTDGAKGPLKDFKTFLEVIGNIVQGNLDSLNPQVYGQLDSLLRKIINGGDNVPGVLYHFQTSLRDPAFFQMYKYLLRFYWHFLESFPSYTKDQLTFEGVKIKSAEVDKLVTYFDKFDADITNVVDAEYYDGKKGTDLYEFGRSSNYEGTDYVIKARQTRLNHLPFTFKLTVSSSKVQKATVKVFIGPKKDFYGQPIDINENRKNFFELDYFLVDLVEGENVITRSSSDFTWYVNDRTTYYDLYRKLFQSFSTNEKFSLDMSEAHCGFPNRLMLPKGKAYGMPFEFFFFVAPYQEPAVEQFTGFDPTISCGIGSGARYLDDSVFSYPLDRKIDIKNWYVDNMFYLDTKIFHKSENEINVVRS